MKNWSGSCSLGKRAWPVLVLVIVVSWAIGFCWHHVKTSTAALSSVELGLNSGHCVGSMVVIDKLLGGEWVVGGHSEPEVERNTNLTDMHKCSYVSDMHNCSYVSDMQHCCLFQQSRAQFKMNCDYGVGLLLGGHVFILFCIVFLAYSYTNFPRVSCSVSFSCWSKTVHVFTGSEPHWLIWIQPSLTGLFSTGVYCLESDYNDSLLRKMVFHSI